MDAPSPTPERSRELADLQRRAYGPGAGNRLDADVLRRLRELEELSRPREPEAASAAPDAVLQTADSISVAGDRERVALATEPPDEARAPKRWRRIPLWAAIALSGAVSLATAITVGLYQAPQPDALLRPVGEVTADLSTRWVSGLMNSFGLERVTEHDSFGRFHVLSGTNESGSSCLMIVWENIWADASCVPPSLSPIVDYFQYAGGADPTREDLAPGSVIRFELRDGAVDVTVRRAESAS